MRARTFLGLALPLVVALAPAARAQDLLPVPPLAGRVTDLTGTLSAQQVAALDKQLADFEARKGAQIAVLVVPTTKPETIEQFGIRVAEKWKVGREKADDGAIVIVAKNDRTLRIEVGYGLEGAVPDLKASRIIREIIVPRFRQNDFYGGLEAGTQALIGLIEGEDLPPPARTQRKPGGFENLNSVFMILLIFTMIVGTVLTRVAGRFVGSALTGGAAGLIAWVLVGTLLAAIVAGLMVFVFTLGRGVTGLGSTGSRRGGGWPGGGWSGGGGGWSGGGGGSWSGGGGSFGGGGASGRW